MHVYRLLVPIGLIFLISLLVGTTAQAQNTDSLILQGDSLLAAGKASRALELFEQAVKGEKSVDTYLARARALYQMDKMDRFLQDVDRALKLDSNNAEANFQRALHASRTASPEGVEYYSAKTIARGRDSLLVGRALILRGLSRDAESRSAAAIDDLERGTRMVPDDTEGRRALSRLYDSVGRYEDALKVLSRLIELEPDDIGHWTNRAFELSQLERFGEAMGAVQQALLMDKDEPVALANRAYINLKLGHDKEAMTDIERSLRSLPGNPYALRTRALLRLRKGEREKACQDLTLAQVLGQIPEVDQLVQEHCASTPPRQRK
jgi:tetratricopeptide (TPR) repeat protein